MTGEARFAGRIGDVAAALVLIASLLLPDRLTSTDLGAFAAVPVELVLGAAALLVLPPAGRRPVAAAFGVLLGVLTVLKIIDAGFYAALARPFDLVLDWGLADGAWRLLAASLGAGPALGVVAVALLVALAVPTVIVWAMLRLARLLDDHASAAVPVVAALSAFWLGSAATGLILATPYPAAARSSTTKIIEEVSSFRSGLRDEQVFAAEAAQDDFGEIPADRLLTGLRGKQVLLVFVESYGRVALEDPVIAGEVGPVLAGGDRALAASGLQARSGYLTSPTTGGGSWLAHATLLSGLWIDGQQRYLNLVASDRFTLTEAFGRAGWRTLGVMPGVTTAWPDGSFYHFDEIHDAAQLGYAGPAYGWSRVPDQFTLGRVRALASSLPGQRPTMTVTPLVTSHAPWTPVPPLVDWDELGDGRRYGQPGAEAEPPEAILTREPARVRTDYARSVSYSVASVISYTTQRADDDLVVIMVGDHQPAPVVTGPDAGRDVPITVIAGDPAVLARIRDWGWSPGLRPGAEAPVWRMDAFRDRLLTTFGPP